MRIVRVGLLGCGNIGCGVFHLLNEMKQELVHREGYELRVCRALVRSMNRRRSEEIPQEILTDDPAMVLDAPDIDLVVEVMGGEQPATDYMVRALKNGKTVVTANKMALALNWHLLQGAAVDGKAGLFYEAAVGGAMPVMNVLNHSLQANRIDRLAAIINGTTNYILTGMAEEGMEYETALRKAQQLGYAEPDPTADVDGYDAMYKLSILASLAFHAHIPVSCIARQGLTHITGLDIAGAREFGYQIKLLAIAARNGNTVDARVSPSLIPADHPLSSVRGAFNAVYLHGHACGDMMVYGRGAGSAPTASAVVSDCLAAVDSDKPYYPTFKNTDNALAAPLQMADNRRSAFYLRVSAKDMPGVLSHVTGCLSEAGISVCAISQKEPKAEGSAQIMLVTHPAYEKDMRAAIQKFNAQYVSVENLLYVEE